MGATNDYTMNIDITELTGAAAGGMLLGLIFFGGLYLTVASLPRRSHRARTLLLSALARLGLVLGGFYLIGAGNPPRMLTALVGFIVMRQILLLTLGKKHDPNPVNDHETR